MQLKFTDSGCGITQIMTKKYAVLGSPIAHSLSPMIHSHVLSELAIDSSYEKFEIGTDLSEFLNDKNDYSGFSLTMPLKDMGFQISENLSATARQTRSVNTLLRTESGWAGYNTDVFGIRTAVGFEPKSVAVLGSGATARSALAAFPNSEKLIGARNTFAAKQLSEQFNAKVVALEIALATEVVVSTLPVGVLATIVPSGFRFQTLLDAAYMNQRFEAQNFVSGLEMLLLQAVAQQRIFSGQGEHVPLPNEPALINGLRALLNVAK